MKIYDVLGWVWASGQIASKCNFLRKNQPNTIGFHNNIAHQCYEEFGYNKAIPFSQIKGLK